MAVSSSSSSSSSEILTGPQVFINFRGSELRTNFVDFLVHKMKAEKINVFIDNHALKGTDLKNLFVKIQESRIALVIFSQNYTTSTWCLNELVKINECVDAGTLIAIPIFFKVDTITVKKLKGEFGEAFRDLKHNNRHDLVNTTKWEEALVSISGKLGMEFVANGHKTERVFIEEIVEEVNKVLYYISIGGNAAVSQQSEAIQTKQHQSGQIQQPDPLWEAIQEANRLRFLEKKKEQMEYFNKMGKQIARYNQERRTRP